MGIKLDWDLEADDGWGEIEEDAGALHTRRMRRQRIVRSITAVVAVVGLIVAAVVFRLRQVREQLTTTLEATVTAETLALRLGDRNGFLRLQADIDDWRRAQARVFEEYQTFGRRISTEGEIVDMQIEGTTARVVLREWLDGEPFTVAWFYEYTDDGWRRVPPSSDVLGEVNTLSLYGSEVAYHEADRAFAEALARQVDAWWQAGCALTGCDPQAAERPRIEITADAREAPGWDGDTLRVHSQAHGRTPENGDQLPAPITTWLANEMAVELAYRALGGEEMRTYPSADSRWFQKELAMWLGHQFDPALPTSGFVEALVAAYSPSILTAVMDNVRTSGQLVPELEAAAGVTALEMPVDWSGYLANRLRLEALLIEDGDPTGAALLFRDMDELRTPETVIDFATEQRATPSSIGVVDLETDGDLVLATVVFSTRGEDGEGQSGMQLSYEPFRLQDGKWIHTSLEFQDWGSGYGTRSEHFLLTYYELDREAVEGLLALMETIYPQVMSRYGLAPDPAARYWLAVTPTQERNLYVGMPPLALQEFAAVLRVLSPHASARAAYVSDQEYARALATWALLEAIVARQVAPMPVDNPFSTAFITWGFDQAGLSQAALPPEVRAEVEESWTIQVLLDLLVEQHGVEAIPQLMTNLPGSTSTDDWLARSLGIEDGEQVRDLWQDCLDDRLNCPLDY